MTERQLPGAEHLIREETDKPHCFVRHPDAGGQCFEPAAMEVYGLAFCEIHGPEVKAGALAELHQDAAWFLERLDNPHVPRMNPAAAAALDTAIRGQYEAIHEAESSDAILARAYPLIGERVIDETLDPASWNTPGREPPVDWLFHWRLLCHKLMRIAHEQDATFLVEMIEEVREHFSAQLAFAHEYKDRLTTR